MVRERSVALMSPRGPGAVALTLGFTSLRSHPVPSLRWECENTVKYFFLASFSAPWCHLSDGCHLTHDYGRLRPCTGCSMAEGYRKPIASSTKSRATEKLERVFVDLSGGVLIRCLVRSCLLYTSPSPRDGLLSRMPSSA